MSELENCEYIFLWMIYWSPIMEGKETREKERGYARESDAY
jgi:hypothetical protein